MKKISLLVAVLLALAYGVAYPWPWGGGGGGVAGTGSVTTTEIFDGTITGDDLSSTINIVTTGTIQGAVKILDNVTSPTTSQLYGTLDIVTGNTTVTPTAAIAGMSICILDGGATHDNVVFDVPGTDNVILLGTTGAGGVGITNSGGTTIGDYVCLIATAANKWRVFGYQGTWASQ